MLLKILPVASSKAVVWRCKIDLGKRMKTWAQQAKELNNFFNLKQVQRITSIYGCSQRKVKCIRPAYLNKLGNERIPCGVSINSSQKCAQFLHSFAVCWTNLSRFGPTNQSFLFRHFYITPCHASSFLKWIVFLLMKYKCSIVDLRQIGIVQLR